MEFLYLWGIATEGTFQRVNQTSLWDNNFTVQ